MPIYEYVCKECDTTFEDIVLKQDDIPSCPQCDSVNTSKLISKSRHMSNNGSSQESFSSQSSSSSCSGCAGGSCSTCK